MYQTQLSPQLRTALANYVKCQWPKAKKKNIGILLGPDSEDQETELLKHSVNNGMY